MSLRIDALTIDAADADRLGRFWAAALGWTVEIDDDEDTLVIPPEGTGVQLLPLNVPEAKVAQNSMHFDLSTTSVEDQ
ncbi:MAG TPA: VOC family protein, partial [Mycobacteriales bacterium]|nr:VOC family protein [Mycobacteriales bacterium]